MRRVDQWELVISVARHARQDFCSTSGEYYGQSAYRIAGSLDKLARIARTLHRLYEHACNEPTKICAACLNASVTWSPVLHKPSACFNARLERLEKRAADLGTELGVVVTTQRDPRGAAVKVWADKEDGRLLGVL